MNHKIRFGQQVYNHSSTNDDVHAMIPSQLLLSFGANILACNFINEKMGKRGLKSSFIEPFVNNNTINHAKTCSRC